MKGVIYYNLRMKVIALESDKGWESYFIPIPGFLHFFNGDIL